MSSDGICVICNNPYPTDDNHHVIPREYGGSDGPTLNICPGCHQILHRAVKVPMIADKWLSQLSPQGKEVAKKLLQVIKQAEASGNTSDIITLSVKIPRQLHTRLKTYAKDYGTSIEELVNRILSQSFGI